MKWRYILLFAVQFASVSLYAQAWDRTNLNIYTDFDELAQTFQISDDTIHVINFWATWCKPCVAELPYFESLIDTDFKNPIKVTLISMDFKKQIDTKLIPFLNEEQIKSNVALLLDGKFNTFIDKVDPSWEGSIPATLIIKGEKRLFYERVFHDVEELVDIVNTIND